MTGQGDTLGSVLLAATRRLAAAGVDSPRRDARLLAAHALGLDSREAILWPERPLSVSERCAVQAAIARRAAREPVSRIIGQRGFWTLTLGLNPDTLDPRPDSEAVIEAALATVADRKASLTVLDLGVGSGCLLLALLSELPNATGVGVDISPGAVAMASRNAAAAGLAARVCLQTGDWGLGDWRKGVKGSFDLVLSNPPYIPDGEIETLAPEVAAFDPRRALAGGADGLDAYRILAPQVVAVLRPQGVAVLEVGSGQADAVRTLLEAAGLEFIGVHPDLSGVERCVLMRRRA